MWIFIQKGERHGDKHVNWAMNARYIHTFAFEWFPPSPLAHTMKNEGIKAPKPFLIQ